MANLQLAVKGEYFDQIKRGDKKEEYRLVNEYWCRRLVREWDQSFLHFDRLIITRGYPRKDDESRRIDVKYCGYEVKTITHPHFGPEPVRVFAIKINIE